METLYGLTNEQINRLEEWADACGIEYDENDPSYVGILKRKFRRASGGFLPSSKLILK